MSLLYFVIGKNTHGSQQAREEIFNPDSDIAPFLGFGYKGGSSEENAMSVARSIAQNNPGKDIYVLVPVKIVRCDIQQPTTREFLPDGSIVPV